MDSLYGHILWCMSRRTTQNQKFSTYEWTYEYFQLSFLLLFSLCQLRNALLAERESWQEQEFALQKKRKINVDARAWES